MKSNLDRRQKYIFMILCLAVTGYCMFLLLQYKENIVYAEIDSYVLPTISIQYRGSLLMNAEDLKRAQIDYPMLYKDINGYEDLRSAKLLVLPSGKWKSYYFPIYSIICMPAKLVLQLLGMNQEWTFGITNVLCMMALFIVLLRSNRLLFIQKTIAILLMMASPSFLYVKYISAETMIFSFVGIAVLLFYERKYKSAAVITTFAGMCNCTVMAIGIVFILDYYAYAFVHNKGKRFRDFIKAEFWQSVKLALCFLPIFIPFLFNFLVKAKGVSEYMYMLVQHGTLQYIGRVLSYFFDPNLGIASFAPVLEISCIGILIYAIVQKKYLAISLMSAFVATVVAYGSMWHINCGMLYCARYVYWTYPILVIFMSTVGYECIRSRYQYVAVNLLSVFIGLILLNYNNNTYYNYLTFNNLTEKILDVAPGLYNPLHSVFNSRTLSLDGGYDYNTPVIYYNGDRYIRKILAVKDDLKKLQELCAGSDDDMKWFESQVCALSDKKSYVSIPKKYKISYAPKYEPGEYVLFYSDSYNADKYVSGLSYKEDGFTWTDGKKVKVQCKINNPAKIIHGHIDLRMVNEEQSVTILAGGVEVYQNTIRNGMDIDFDFELPENGHLADIEIQLPDAASPYSRGGSSDKRVLGLAIERMIFSESTNDRLYEPGESIMFYSDSYNADKYIVSGISAKEDGFTWTDGKEVVICCSIAGEVGEMHGTIELQGIYGRQNVIVLVNGKQVFRDVRENNENIEFDFVKETAGDLVYIKMLLPDAISPASLGESADERILGLALRRIVLTEK